MKFLERYYISDDPNRLQGIHFLCFKIDFFRWERRFKFDWFTDCGEWFVYFRWYRYMTLFNSLVTEVRFSGAGYLKSMYLSSGYLNA